MKIYFTAPITSLEEAHDFFRQLHNDGLLFHPEDRPETIGIFTPEEARALSERILEVYTFDLDPCAFIMDNLN